MVLVSIQIVPSVHGTLLMQQYLVVLPGGPAGHAGTLVPRLGAGLGALGAAAVPAAALDQQAAGPEDGVRPPQLLAQRHRHVPRGAAVQTDLLPQLVQVCSHWRHSGTTTRHQAQPDHHPHQHSRTTTPHQAQCTTDPYLLLRTGLIREVLLKDLSLQGGSP